MRKAKVKRESDSIVRKNGRKKSLSSRDKQSLGRALYQVARLGGCQNQVSEYKGNSDFGAKGENNSEIVKDDGIPMKNFKASMSLENL
ncbi:hypothetical protein U1Q18_011691 [Sarracenia purpurea var. burkii]